MFLRTLKNVKLARSFASKPPGKSNKVFGFAKGKKQQGNRNNEKGGAALGK